MVSYAPNVSWLFPELPFAERVRAVAKAGFSALEFGFPSHADLDSLAAACAEWGITIVLFNQDVPVWDAANRGYLADPARCDEFKTRLDEAFTVAAKLSVKKIMLPVGVRIPAITWEEQYASIIRNLSYAALQAEQAGVLLTIEMLNPHDNPGYFLTDTATGFSIVREVSHPYVRFQFDTYHIQLMEGNLIEKLEANIDLVGHLQFADVPGRHEPGTGEINFANVAKAAQQAGYTEHIGLEYRPLAHGLEALRWCLSDPH